MLQRFSSIHPNPCHYSWSSGKVCHYSCYSALLMLLCPVDKCVTTVSTVVTLYCCIQLTDVSLQLVKGWHFAALSSWYLCYYIWYNPDFVLLCPVDGCVTTSGTVLTLCHCVPVYRCVTTVSTFLTLYCCVQLTGVLLQLVQCWPCTTVSCWQMCHYCWYNGDIVLLCPVGRCVGTAGTVLTLCRFVTTADTFLTLYCCVQLAVVLL